jgi:hypothetical protein
VRRYFLLLDCTVDARSRANQFGGLRGVVETTFSHRIANHSPFDSTGNRTLVGHKAATSSVPLSPGKRLSPCNLRERRLLCHSDLYRRFEFLPLRQTVWVAEKSGCVPRKITRNRRNSANLALKPDWRKWPFELSRQSLGSFSLKGASSVRFQRHRQANAMRSQTHDSAKAT